MKKTTQNYRRHSFVILICLFSFLSICHSQSQLSKWHLNGKQIDFEDTPPTVSTLPASNSTGFDIGASNGFYGPQGDLLFFISGQRIFSKEGELIDVLLSDTNAGTYQDEGIRSEIGVVPVPGSTCKYFIIFSRYFSETNPLRLSVGLYYSELDLTLQNDENSNLIGDLTPSKKNLSLGLWVSPSISHALGFAIRKTNSATYPYFLYVVSSEDESQGSDIIVGRVRKYNVTSNGISTQAASTIIHEQIGSSGNGYFPREVDLSHDGTMLVFAEGIQLEVARILHLDPVTGELDTSQPNGGIDGFSVSNFISGHEFSPDNNFLFLSLKNIGILKRNLIQNTDDIIPISEEYDESHVELASNGKMYFAGDDNLGEYDLNTSTFTANAIQNLDNNTIVTYSDPENSVHYTLPDQIDGFNYQDIYINGVEMECCSAISAYEATSYEVDDGGTYTWTENTNPFGNTSIVRVQDKLTIKNNSQLTISGLEFQFAEGAGIVVEKGSRLTILNMSLLTSTDCESTWEGIQVWGDIQENQYGTGNQGSLILGNSTIEHATTAVRMYSTESINKTGGIIRAINTDFLNNAKGVQFNQYKNTTPSGQHAGNLSYFRDCTFRIDNDYRFDDKMDGHIKMWGVDGINIYGCSFEHTQDVSTPSDRSYAIRAFNAGFNVRPICESGPPNGPCEVWDRNEFSGFYDAISAQSGSAAQPYHGYYIDRASFEANRIGVNSTAVDNSTIVRSDFNIGNFVAANYSGLSEGVFLNTGTGYTIEQNNFVSTPLGGGIELGVRAYDTGPDDNQIYKNNFTNLFAGNLAQRQNREDPDVEDGNGGLRYFCNINSGNNYDFYVTSISANEHGIATNQGVMPLSPTGNAIRSAGNTFSHLWSDFRNFSTFNPVIYWHTQGEDIPTVGLLNTFANPNAVNSNTCPDNFTDGDVMFVLSPAEMNDLTTKYVGHRNTLSNLLQQLNASIDDGDTQAMVNKINTWGGTSKGLKMDLLATAPFLSRAALEAVIDRSDLLSDEQRHDILAANPVELRDETLFDYIANSVDPLSSPYINSLKSASELFLSRSALEGEISARKATIAYLVGKGLKSTLQDTMTSDLNEVRTWLQRKGKIDSELALAETYISEGDLSVAAAYIANIGATWNFGQSDLAKYNQFDAIKTLQMQLITEGRSWAELDSLELVELTTIAEAEAGFPTAQAQGILDFFYGYSYKIPLDLEGADPYSDLEESESYENVKSRIMAYPNPANEWITFQFDKPLATGTKLTFSNLSGKAIASFKLEAGQLQYRISTSGYPVGTYFYQLVINGENEIGKIVLIK